jgi:glutathione synthase/RimK-type ligase-like ATP-grasp enzyme
MKYAITSVKDYEALNFEKKSLFDVAKKYFEEVMLIDTRKVTYKFIRGLETPILKHKGNEITNLSAVHIRSTKNREASTALLAHTLILCGCILNDPVSRFNAGFASKLLSTTTRFKNKTGSSSFLAFEHESTLELLDEIEKSDMFPLIVKPIRGSKGTGVELLENKKKAVRYSKEFFETRESEDSPIFFQKYITFVAEYRAFVIDKKVIDLVRKVKMPHAIVANAAQGGKFINEKNKEVENYVSNNLTEDGIYGVDVAVDNNGDIHIIETNRAPMWKTFEEATKINVAETIVSDTLKKIKEKQKDTEKEKDINDN